MPRHPDEMGYEHHDIAVGQVVIFGVCLAVTLTIACGVLWEVHYALRTDTTAEATSGYPPLHRIPPWPHLQGSPLEPQPGREQMQVFLQKETARLDSSGIQNAMALVAAQGLPDWPATPIPVVKRVPPPVIHARAPQTVPLSGAHGISGFGPQPLVALVRPPERHPEQGSLVYLLPWLRVLGLLIVAAVVLLVAWLSRHDLPPGVDP